jgi:hypothetical protein
VLLTGPRDAPPTPSVTLLVEPVPLVGLDSDNGSEFIYHRLDTSCQREGITFTRSRSDKKNDGAHVEQKNGAVVRRLVGYDRFASRAAYTQLARVSTAPALQSPLLGPHRRCLR